MTTHQDWTDHAAERGHLHVDYRPLLSLITSCNQPTQPETIMKHVLQFTKEKETKGAVRYTETKADLDEGVVGTLYVRKSAFKELGQIPPALKVTIETE